MHPSYIGKKMNIVGLLIKTLPEHSAQVAAQLPTLGAQVHLISEQGQLVVTLEHADDKVITDCITQIQSLQGVLNAAMVYHQIDDETSIMQENPL